MDGKFYLYYTASPNYSPRNSGNHVGLAIADQIEGPYMDMGRVVQQPDTILLSILNNFENKRTY